MARAPALAQPAAFDIADQLSYLLGRAGDRKSSEAAFDQLRIELDASLPICTLAPSGLGHWDPAIDIALQASVTEYWHHQVRVRDVVDRYATSRIAGEGNARPLVTSMSPPSVLARSIDTAITLIDRDDHDDSSVASLLKVPTHAVLAILLANEQQGSELFIVTTPRSFDRVQAGKRYRSSGEFLEELNRERAGGGYRRSIVTRTP